MLDAGADAAPVLKNASAALLLPLLRRGGFSLASAEAAVDEATPLMTARHQTPRACTLSKASEQVACKACKGVQGVQAPAAPCRRAKTASRRQRGYAWSWAQMRRPSSRLRARSTPPAAAGAPRSSQHRCGGGTVPELMIARMSVKRFETLTSLPLQGGNPECLELVLRAGAPLTEEQLPQALSLASACPCVPSSPLSSGIILGTSLCPCHVQAVAAGKDALATARILWDRVPSHGLRFEDEAQLATLPPALAAGEAGRLSRTALASMLLLAAGAPSNPQPQPSPAMCPQSERTLAVIGSPSSGTQPPSRLITPCATRRRHGSAQPRPRGLAAGARRGAGRTGRPGGERTV